MDADLTSGGLRLCECPGGRALGFPELMHVLMLDMLVLNVLDAVMGEGRPWRSVKGCLGSLSLPLSRYQLTCLEMERSHGGGL